MSLIKQLAETGKGPIKPVQVRGGFSDRNNITPLNNQIQLTEFDHHTKVAILNCLSDIHHVLLQCVTTQAFTKGWEDFYLELGKNVYCEEIDSTGLYELREIQKYFHELIRSTIYTRL